MYNKNMIIFCVKKVILGNIRLIVEIFAEIGISA